MPACIFETWWHVLYSDGGGEGNGQPKQRPLLIRVWPGCGHVAQVTVSTTHVVERGGYVQEVDSLVDVHRYNQGALAMQVVYLFFLTNAICYCNQTAEPLCWQWRGAGKAGVGDKATGGETGHQP